MSRQTLLIAPNRPIELCHMLYLGQHAFSGLIGLDTPDRWTWNQIVWMSICYMDITASVPVQSALGGS